MVLVTLILSVVTCTVYGLPHPVCYSAVFEKKALMQLVYSIGLPLGKTDCAFKKLSRATCICSLVLQNMWRSVHQCFFRNYQGLDGFDNVYGRDYQSVALEPTRCSGSFYWVLWMAWMFVKLEHFTKWSLLNYYQEPDNCIIYAMTKRASILNRSLIFSFVNYMLH